MSNIKETDPVIRNLDKKNQLGIDEELIKIEVGKIMGFKKWKYFAVSTVNHANLSGITYKLNNALTIQIPYVISCPTGNEEKVVTSLYEKGKSLDYSLNRKLKNWLSVFISKNGESAILKNKEEVQLFLAERALTEIGLTLRPKVKLQNEDKLNEHPIALKFSVRVRNFDKKIILSLKTDLLIDEENPDLALIYYQKLEDIESKVKKLIKNELLMQYSLHTFCTQLDSTIKNNLIEVMNPVLKPYGRFITHLELYSPNIPNLLPEKDPIEVKHNGDYDIADYNQKVNVENTLILKLFDIGLLKKKKINNISNWLKVDIIPVVVQDALFRQNYKNVLLDLETITNKIKEDIAQALKEVGYNVKQHAFIPSLKELKLINDGFDDSSIDASFVTSNSDVNINIQVNYKGQIGQLKELEDRLLLPNVDIEAEMRDTVRSTIEEIIHRVDPERAYMGFENIYKGYDLSVKEEIELTIKQRLSEKFKADLSSLKVFVKQTKSEITEKARALVESTHDLLSVITPRRNIKYTEKIDYHIRFQIIKVYPDGWPVFQKNIKRKSVDEIKEMKTILEENIRTLFETIPYEIHVSGKLDSRKQLMNLLKGDVLPRVGKLFGLHLNLVSFNRNDTILEGEAQLTRLELGKKEEEQNRVIQSNFLESRKNTVNDLLKKRQELLTEGEYDEAEEVEEQINKLRAEFSYNKIQSLTTNTDSKLIDAGAEEFTWDEFGPLLSGLNEGENNQSDKNNDDEHS